MQHLAALRQQTPYTCVINNSPWTCFRCKAKYTNLSSFCTILAVIAKKKYPILKLQNSFRNTSSVGFKRTDEASWLKQSSSLTCAFMIFDRRSEKFIGRNILENLKKLFETLLSLNKAWFESLLEFWSKNFLAKLDNNDFWVIFPNATR